MCRPRACIGAGRETDACQSRLDPRHRMVDGFAEPRDPGLDSGGVRATGRADGLSPREGPTADIGDRIRRSGRSILVQGAPASRGIGPREERGGRTPGHERRLRPGGPLPRESVRRFARLRERLRGDGPPPSGRGRPPTPRRGRDAPDRRRPRRRRPILAVRPERDRRRRRPGGRPMKKVGVIGAGMTLFRRRLQETGKEMCFEATKMALDSAGLTRADVDMVVNGAAPDAFDGVHMKGEYLADGCGGYRKPYTRVFTGGGTGVFSTIAGWWHVASGLADVVLVVNEEKMSSCQPHPQSVFAHIWDPILDRPLKPNLVWIFAMEMNRYMHVHGVKKEDIARVAVKNTGNAVGHPRAQLADPSSTVDGVLAAKKGEAPILTREGVTERDGDLPVCPSGGLMGVGNPIAATMGQKIGELFWQLTNQAGKRQIPHEVHTGVAQAWGDLMQYGSVVVMSS